MNAACAAMWLVVVEIRRGGRGLTYFRPLEFLYLFPQLPHLKGFLESTSTSSIWELPRTLAASEAGVSMSSGNEPGIGPSSASIDCSTAFRLRTATAGVASVPPATPVSLWLTLPNDTRSCRSTDFLFRLCLAANTPFVCLS